MNKETILVIDDEDQLRQLLSRIIRLEGFTVLEAPTLKQAWTIIEKSEPDIILCDVKLPDGNGVDFVPELKKKHAAIEIILLTAYGNIPDGIQAMKNGAMDYIVKGNDNDKIIPLLQRAAEKIQLRKKITQLQAKVGKQYDFDSIIGQSTLIQKAKSLAAKVAPTDTTVLLLGETGTGKEVFAQAIHNASKRNTHPFVAINCSAFPHELLESELFGHKAGSFTGATKEKKGLLEEAQGGTVFLDEIGDMPMDLQTKLLRVLETREFYKVGDSQPTKVDVRIITATNRNLEEEVKKNNFRNDLFYRINIFTIDLPPLRERKEDIAALATFYTKQFAEKTGKKINSLSPALLKKLEKQYWKGNIRELKNSIERAVILTDTNELKEDDISNEVSTGSVESFELASVEKFHIQKILKHTGGNKTETARLLGIGLTTLYRKIEEYGL